MTSDRATSNWFVCRKTGTEAVLRLFCFPYAGGSASIFRDWTEGLPASVEVCAVQLPGRGSRLLETAITAMPQLVRALARAIHPYLDQPFAFFGHSMGTIVSLELARYLRAKHGREPAHLFVSGSRAPHVRELEPRSYDLPEAEFREVLRRLNGTPAEILEHPELMQLMLPVLRADFKLFQTYAYTEARPLTCPITAYGGLRDKEVDRKRLQEWRTHTNARFTLHMLPGDHFFIHTAQAALLASLSTALNELVSRTSSV